MDKFRVAGPTKLNGKISISGSKNATLPIIFATLMTDQENVLSRVPNLSDIKTAGQILQSFGLKTEIDFASGDWRVHAPDIKNTRADYDLVRKMRASFFCIGPLLARAGQAEVSIPGGCAIGARPIDLHLSALKSFGIQIDESGGYIEAKVPSSGLVGGQVIFPKVSVGATETALMTAVLAKGSSIIRNAAREPEVIALANCLKSMGAKIEGEGTSKIEIEGVDQLGALNCAVPADRIEAATYMIAAQMTGGELVLDNIGTGDMEIVIECLKQSGASVESIEENNQTSIRVKASEEILPVDIETAPFPGFPTDVQAQWVALMTQAEGESFVTEKIFENRFMHVPELRRMGAEIKVTGNTVKIKGKRSGLNAAPVMATDLRASASLVLAGLCAEGETHVKRIYHLDRGYVSMEKKLNGAGAKIIRDFE